MSLSNKDMLSQLSPVVTIIPRSYVYALLTLHQKLGEGIKWVLIGDLGECLRTVQVEPDCIEILASKRDAEKILTLAGEFNPTRIAVQIKRLLRNAVISGKECPVFVRSHHFEFILNGISVKVQGDLQFKVGDWDWGDTLDFTPEYVYVVGKKTAVIPLSVAAELYQYLGWTDRLEKIKQVTQRPLLLKTGNFRLR